MLVAGVATPATTFHDPLRLPIASSQAGPFFAGFNDDETLECKNVSHYNMFPHRR